MTDARAPIKLTLEQLLEVLQVSKPTAYKYSKENNWTITKNVEGKSIFHVPPDSLKQYVNDLDTVLSRFNEPQNKSGTVVDNNTINRLIDMLEKSFEEQLKLKEELYKKTIIEKESEITALNHQLANAQNQLIKVRETQGQKEKKPFWRFWS